MTNVIERQARDNLLEIGNRGEGGRGKYTSQPSTDIPTLS